MSQSVLLPRNFYLIGSMWKSIMSFSIYNWSIPRVWQWKLHRAKVSSAASQPFSNFFVESASQLWHSILMSNIICVKWTVYTRLYTTNSIIVFLYTYHIQLLYLFCFFIKSIVMIMCTTTQHNHQSHFYHITSAT